jgi:pimeloyl-ACP methyl ester carboxylesterase
VEVDGRTAAYRLAGEGEPLVLVHGLAGSWRWWAPVLDTLAGGHRVHAVDLPRLGRTLRPNELERWLARWLTAVGLDRTDLAGHSLGGLVSAELAAAHPERVRRLVLVAPAGIPCGRGLPGRALALARSLPAVRRSLPMLAADALRTGPIGLAHAIVFVDRRDLREDERVIDVPTLLVWGDHDRLVPPRIADEWRRLAIHARLERVACGHVPMLEAAPELAQLVVAFLREEFPDDPGDELRPGEVDGVGLTRDRDQPASR